MLGLAMERKEEEKKSSVKQSRGGNRPGSSRRREAEEEEEEEEDHPPTIPVAPIIGENLAVCLLLVWRPSCCDFMRPR